MNKKGFTLTELLATIAILSVVITIAVPAVIGVSNSIKENMYKSKKKLLLQAAKLYGEDTNVSGNVYIRDIAPYANNQTGKHYVKCDDNAPEGKCIVNPKNNKDMIWCEITITINPDTGRVSTSWYSIANSDCL